MLAIVCPGQGSQSPGMLAPWLDLPGAREQLSAFSEASGLDLEAHGTVSDADTLRDTRVAQPLIVAASLLAARALLGDRPAADVATVTAGHSVGELSAAAVAGVLTDVEAVRLVTARATAMASAAARVETGMCAIIGGDPQEVLTAVRAAGLRPANINGAGQVVAAGDLESLARLQDAPPAKARIIVLQVAGAFHTPYMQTALEAFAPVAHAQRASDPQLVLLSNADGLSYADLPGAPGPYGSGEQVLRRLAEQIVAPVRWDLCQQTFAALGVTGLLELAPGGVLTGLARRSLPGVETVAVKTPVDLVAALDLCTRHGHPGGATAPQDAVPDAPPSSDASPSSQETTP